MPTAHLLHHGYTRRSEPQYFDDTPTDVLYQPDVYGLAAAVARRLGSPRIIDVGCGNGQKLVELADEFEIVGIDFGPNIEWCRSHHSAGTWIEADLDVPGNLAADARDATIVCSDVIEHVLHPDRLIAKLRAALSQGRALVVSTPERDATHGGRNEGPPANPSHIQEWTMRELGALFRRSGFPYGSVGLTRNNTSEHQWSTILAAYANTPDELSAVEDALIDAAKPALPPEPVDSALGDVKRLGRRVARMVRRG
jgi:SAM-dependent methyltransferase